jgi:hypothetical protein
MFTGVQGPGAPPDVRRAAEQAAARRPARLRTPAPFRATSDSGTDVSTPSPGTAAAIAGAALLIAAAGSARAGSGRTGTPKPRA